MELLADVCGRVLANCRRRMDKRKRKAGGAVEAPPEVPQGQKGGTSLAGKGDRLSPRTTVRRGRTPAGERAGRSLEAAE